MHTKDQLTNPSDTRFCHHLSSHRIWIQQSCSNARYLRDWCSHLQRGTLLTSWHLRRLCLRGHRTSPIQSINWV